MSASRAVREEEVDREIIFDRVASFPIYLTRSRSPASRTRDVLDSRQTVVERTRCMDRASRCVYVARNKVEHVSRRII